MENFVTITAAPSFLADGITPNPKAGQVFIQNAKLGKDGREHGYVRLVSTNLKMQGYAKLEKRSALMPISKEDFLLAEREYNLRAGVVKQGKIIYLDSMEPLAGYKSMPVKNRVTGVVNHVTKDGKIVYRKTDFVEDLTLTDKKFSYDKVLTPIEPAVIEIIEPAVSEVVDPAVSEVIEVIEAPISLVEVIEPAVSLVEGP